MKKRLLHVLRLLAFPAFYVFCLALFGYLTFPFGRLKDRFIAELEKRGKPGQRVEIAKLGSYWFSGVEVSGVKLHLPPDDPPPPGRAGAADLASAAGPAKESVIVIDEAHARVRILPLLLGRVRLDFWASMFGGEIKGSAPVGSGKGEVEVSIDHVELSRIEPLAQAKVPLKGAVTGKLALEAPEGKFNKASGSLDLTISDLVVSDGTTKIRDYIVLPPAKLGDLVIAAEAKEGALKINKLTAGGTDLELAGDGKIALREPWTEAIADLYVRFRFTDAYRGKNDLTKGLLGAPGSKVAGSIDLMPDMKQAKRPDGFYGWKVYGPLKKLRFDPSPNDTSGSTSSVTAAPRRPMGRGMDGPRRPLPIGGGRDPEIAGTPALPAPERSPSLPPVAVPAPGDHEIPEGRMPLRSPAAPQLTPPPAPPPPVQPPPTPPSPVQPPPVQPPPVQPPPAQPPPAQPPPVDLPAQPTPPPEGAPAP